MKITELNISGVWVGSLEKFSDERGAFFEWFKQTSTLNQNKVNFDLKQANCSFSSKGVVRGIHFARIPPGQAKYVTCLSGEVFDVVVDLRPTSPTFGEWEGVTLNGDEPKVMYIPNGIGHAFMSMHENSIFVYLCDQTYNPENEFEINPFDEDLAIDWPLKTEIKISSKDKLAPSFREISEKLKTNTL